MRRVFGLSFLLIATLLMLGLPTLIAQDSYTARYEGIPFRRLDDGGFVLGNPDAPITLVEFADFICPHCQTYQAVAHEFIEKYVATGQAQFEYRMFPVVDRTLSPLTARLATCAAEQLDGGFWPAHDILYDLAQARQVNSETYKVVADLLGISAEKLLVCADRANQHEIDTALAQSLGISGTPAIMFRLPDGDLGWAYVNGRLYNRGGAPFPIIEAVVTADDFSQVVYVPQSLLADLVDAEAACQAPCWRGVTPGETTWQEGLDLIQNTPIFVDVQSGRDPNSEAAVIQWRTIDSQLDAANRMFTEDGQTVAQISLIELSPYTIGQVIAAQGEPSLVQASLSGSTHAILNLFYPEKSLVVTIYIVLTADTDLTEDSQVVGAYYLLPQTMEALLRDTPLVEWNGYDSFADYLLD